MLNDTSRWTQAQSEFATLGDQLHGFLLSKGAEPLGLVHSTICYSYKGFVFEVQLDILGLTPENRKE